MGAGGASQIGAVDGWRPVGSAEQLLGRGRTHFDIVSIGRCPCS
jgi:hypothetical protein